MTTRELIEQRTKLIHDMRMLVATADAEKRELTSEESGKWDEMDADAERLKATIARRQKLEDEERALDNPRAEAIKDPEKRVQAVSKEERDRREMSAWQQWVRFGYEGMNEEQRLIMNKRRVRVDASELGVEARAQSTSTSAGGYLVPQGFSEELQKFLKAYGGVRPIARAFPTPIGNDIPWPTVDDTSNVGELLTENSPANPQDVAFGQVTLHAYKFSSKIVLVSLELLQDSFFDVNVLLRDLLGERLGRITTQYFTTGTGTSQPQGVTACVGSSGTGVVATSGQTGSIIYDDLVNTVHGVDPLYRPGAYWMFNDGTLKTIKKLKDSNGRPLWQPYQVSGFGPGDVAQDAILGYPYSINQNMPDIGRSGSPLVGNPSILFGDFKRFVVRDVMEMTLLRLTERYAEYGQVGFLAFMRCDARYINTKAVTFWQVANS